MAYPTNSLRAVLEDVDRYAIDLKSFCQRRKAEMLASNVPSTTIFDVFIHMRQARAAFNSAAGVAGLGAYAQAQKGDGSLDIVAEFTAMTSAIDGVTSWISTNFPKDGSGYLLAQTLGADGPTDRQFTSAQTAGLRTALDAVINSIA